jgi:hypothetical protein
VQVNSKLKTPHPVQFNIPTRKIPDYPRFENGVGYASIAKWSVKQCLVEHFHKKGLGDPTSFVTENIDYAKDLDDSDTADHVWFDCPRRSIHTHDEKIAWYNNNNFDQKNAATMTIANMYTQFLDDYRKQAKEYEDLYETQNNSLRTCMESPGNEDGTSEECQRLAQDVKNYVRFPAIHFDLDEWYKVKRLDLNKKSKGKRKYKLRRRKINVDQLGRKTNDEVDHEIESIEFVADNVRPYDNGFLQDGMPWFSTWYAMRRYDNYLRKDVAHSKIWDRSTEAMTCLLILNSNMKLNPEKTKQDIRSYRQQDPDTWIFNEDPWKSEPDPGRRAKHIEVAKRKMPRNWTISQLYFNLNYQYSCRLYADQNHDITNRYDALKIFFREEYCKNELLYKPGSATNGETENFWAERILPYRNKMDVCIDWYCYWLLPLLATSADSNYNLTFTDTDIETALCPTFMTKTENGMVLRVYPSHADSPELTKLKESEKNGLPLHAWPMSKPILYCACEKNCLAMIKFCMINVAPEQRELNINKPRYKYMNELFHAKSEDPRNDNQAFDTDTIWLEEKIVSDEERETSLMTDAHTSPPVEEEESDAEEETGDEVPDASETQPHIATKILLGKSKSVVYNYCLHAAAYHGNHDVVEYLLSIKADPTLKNYWQETALSCATASAIEHANDTTWKDRTLRCVKLLRGV